MFKNKERNPSMGLFLIDSIIVSIILIINIYLRTNITSSILIDENINKYHEYFDLLTCISILSILGCLVLSIYFLQKERKHVTRRLNLLVSLFNGIGIVPIENDNSILTEYDLHVINAWNRSVEEISKQKELRDKYFKNIVHDLKTPIQILRANVEMHEIDYGKNEYTDSMKEELLRLERSVFNYLVVEKISYFEKVEKSNEDLCTYFTIIANRYSKLGFEICLKFKNARRTFQIDRVMFSKVVENLIENAMKHGSGRKMWIIIYDDKIKFANKIENSLVKENLFCENVRHYSKNGNGLGIQIVKTYVELMKFSICSYCHNSLFIVTLTLK